MKRAVYKILDEKYDTNNENRTQRDAYYFTKSERYMQDITVEKKYYFGEKGLNYTQQRIKNKEGDTIKVINKIVQPYLECFRGKAIKKQGEGSDLGWYIFVGDKLDIKYSKESVRGEYWGLVKRFYIFRKIIGNKIKRVKINVEANAKGNIQCFVSEGVDLKLLEDNEKFFDIINTPVELHDRFMLKKYKQLQDEEKLKFKDIIGNLKVAEKPIFKEIEIDAKNNDLIYYSEKIYNKITIGNVKGKMDVRYIDAESVVIQDSDIKDLQISDKVKKISIDKSRILDEEIESKIKSKYNDLYLTNVDFGKTIEIKKLNIARNLEIDYIKNVIKIREIVGRSVDLTGNTIKIKKIVGNDISLQGVNAIDDEVEIRYKKLTTVSQRNKVYIYLKNSIFENDTYIKIMADESQVKDFEENEDVKSILILKGVYLTSRTLDITTDVKKIKILPGGMGQQVNNININLAKQYKDEVIQILVDKKIVEEDRSARVMANDLYEKEKAIRMVLEKHNINIDDDNGRIKYNLRYDFDDE